MNIDDMILPKGFSTPCYYYDLTFLRKTLAAINRFSSSDRFRVHYAMKANCNDRVLSEIVNAGLGADCVSGGEIQKALAMGFKASDITFAGVGKTDQEIRYGLKMGIATFNVESLEELRVINSLAQEMNLIAGVALRINPNIDAQTHHYITTGLNENKFGISAYEIPEALSVIREASSLNLSGLHFHIGSQITNLNVFKGLCIRVNQWKQWFEERGVILRTINVGGGLGINYQNPDHDIPDFKTYFGIFEKFIERKPDQEIHFELGRATVGQCGSLVTKVLYIKKGIKRNFAIVDAGMTELLRPALYQAFHKIEKLGGSSEPTELYDVVGPICESSDVFGQDVCLPILQRNDYLVIRSTGAYGEVMSSHYNLRTLDHIYYKD